MSRMDDDDILCVFVSLSFSFFPSHTVVHTVLCLVYGSSMYVCVFFFSSSFPPPSRPFKGLLQCKS